MQIVKAALFTTFVLYCGTSLRAGVLVAGTDPNPMGGAFVAGASGGQFSLEQLFTLSSAADLTTLDINAGSFDAQTLEVQLYSGLGLEGSGTLLDTFDLSVPAVNSGLILPTISQSVSVPLASGSYSLVLSDPGSSINPIYLNAAESSNTPDGSLRGTHGSTGADFGNIVFELDGNVGTAAPEPASGWLFAGAALLGAGWLVRKRRIEAATNRT